MVGDASAVGPVITISGSTGDDGDYTVASAIFSNPNTTVVVVEAMVGDSGATGTLTTGIPRAGDDVTINNVVAVDVASVGSLNSLTNQGTLTSAVSGDPFYDMSTAVVNIQLIGGTINGFTTEVGFDVNNNSFMVNMNVIEGNNSPTINVNGGAVLTWSGSWTNPDSQINILGGTIIGDNLTINDISTISFNAGTLAGNVTFTVNVMFSDASGGTQAPSIGNGGTITVNSGVTLDMTAYPTIAFGGVFSMYGIIYYGAGATGTATFLLQTKAASVNPNTSINIRYNGPAGNFNSYFAHMGLS